MTAPFLSTANRNCPMRRFLRKKSSLGYFVQETPRMYMGVSQERNCLLNIDSQKQISYDFCTSFALYKSGPLEVPSGSSGSFTCVSRYLANVTTDVVLFTSPRLGRGLMAMGSWELL